MDQESAPAVDELQARVTSWQRRRAQMRWAGIAGGLLLAALLGAALYNTLFPPPTPLTQEQVKASVGQAMASATPPPANSALVYQAIRPSLVIIRTEDTNREGEEGFGVGGGVIVNEGGQILTALHVVTATASIDLFFTDGTRTTGEIISADPANDIAVLQPAQPPEVIVPAVLGSARAMRVGDEAYAVGNPLGLAGSMSAGVISGFERSFTVSGTNRRLVGLIQFDAAVNPGNSGGPLLNRAGQVVGIVTALANPNETESFSGIGFAVPIGTAVTAAGQVDY